MAFEQLAIVGRVLANIQLDFHMTAFACQLPGGDLLPIQPIGKLEQPGQVAGVQVALVIYPLRVAVEAHLAVFIGDLILGV